MHPFWHKLGVRYPIIQAGMVWVSGAKLAAAAAHAGCLGTIGAGSMKPELLEQHLAKANLLAPNLPLAVNVPLLYEKVREQLDVSLKAGVRIFITSAGSPKLHTSYLKDHGATVIHVVSTPELAQKCQLAGVDAVVAEGFEAGGHNGRDELTTMSLIPQVVDSISIPVIAAGGIADGRSMAAALCLGACGVQIGSRFVATVESSAHDHFKNAVIKAGPCDTFLMMKRSVPVRLLKNKFYQQVQMLEEQCANREQLESLLGKGRAKKGMLEGDLDEGELEIGQVAGAISDCPTVQELVLRLVAEYQKTQAQLKGLSL